MVRLDACIDSVGGFPYSNIIIIIVVVIVVIIIVVVIIIIIFIFIISYDIISTLALPLKRILCIQPLIANT